VRGARCRSALDGARPRLTSRRTEAVKFAMFENGNRPQAVIMVPGTLELDMSRKPGAPTAGTQVHVARAA
jgi:hypothetical protein